MLSVSATDLPRLMACNGSHSMGSPEADKNVDTTVRDEGDAAHWFVQEIRSGRFVAEELIDRKAPNGVYITAEMYEYLESYINAVMQGGQVEIETNWAVNGRADHTLYCEKTKTLHVNDLKYGWSIVEPNMNWTLISHAIGWIELYKKPVETIILTIYQPRPYHPMGRIRNISYDIGKLIDFKSQIINTLTNPTDTLKTSEHCSNCPALAHCPAARKAQMNAIDATEKAFNDHLSDDELSLQIDQIGRAVSVLQKQKKAYEDLILDRIRKGHVIRNFTAKADLANRTWKDHVTPEIIKSMTGIDITIPKLKTPAQAEKAGVSKQVVTSLTERHQKGFKLVRVDANSNAQKLFNREN